jgi:hypothetical protein
MSSRAEARRAKRDVGVVPPCNALALQTLRSFIPNGPWYMIRCCGQLPADDHVSGLAGQFNAMLYVPEVKLSTLVGYYSTLALRLRIFRVDAH